jgi:hypothetical protein
MMLTPQRLHRMTEAFRAHGFYPDADNVAVHELASVANCYVVRRSRTCEQLLTAAVGRRPRPDRAREAAT